MEGYEIMFSNRKIKFSHQVSISLLLGVIGFCCHRRNSSVVAQL